MKKFIMLSLLAMSLSTRGVQLGGEDDFEPDCVSCLEKGAAACAYGACWIVFYLERSHYNQTAESMPYWLEHKYPQRTDTLEEYLAKCDQWPLAAVREFAGVELASRDGVTEVSDPPTPSVVLIRAIRAQHHPTALCLTRRGPHPERQE